LTVLRLLLFPAWLVTGVLHVVTGYVFGAIDRCGSRRPSALDIPLRGRR
jgi:hypothetical protein